MLWGHDSNADDRSDLAASSRRRCDGLLGLHLLDLSVEHLALEASTSGEAMKIEE